MSNENKGHWVFRAHVMDRAGALTSIASAFSNEGISIDTVMGHGIEERVGVDGSVVLTFWCSEQEKDVIVRKIKRLSKVTNVEEHPYDSHNLRKSVMIRSTRELAPRDVAGDTAFLTCEVVRTDPDVWTYFLAGPPSEVDQILDLLETEGIVQDIVYSVMSL